ncbi:hypothetical protein LCGC14_1044360 [marine sediment metagenome]|uniref:Uncharacterized protein n=1 Tax=marine sediment metagenome TaxID=412755 RepID=A0A0F9MQQ9_9ZZZZ
MRESKATRLLRTVRIFNDYDFFGQQPYIYRRPRGIGLDLTVSAWMATRRGVSLDDAWYNYGDRPFTYLGREAVAPALAVAKEWAGKRFGITAWARSPFGGWGYADFVKTRMAELRAKARECSS